MRRALFFLMLFGCEDPAALEVRLAIEERDLADLVVVVKRGGKDGTPVFDCSLRLDAEPEGLCPLDGGEGRWTDEAELSFVMYGRPATELSITVDGRRVFTDRLDQTSDLAVVTTTAATARLPPNPGERALLVLPLVDRTTPRLRCASPEISKTPSPDQGSLVVVPGREWFAYVALGDAPTGGTGGLFRARYQAFAQDKNPVIGQGDAESCSIETEQIAKFSCRLRARSLVVREFSTSELLFAGICQNNLDDTTVVQAIVFDTATGQSRTDSMSVPLPSWRVMQPALANLLGPPKGASSPEIAVLLDRPRSSVGLLVWAPMTKTSTVFPVPGVSISPPREVLPGPIVVRRSFLDALIVAGYGGTNVMLLANDGLSLISAPLTSERSLPASQRAPSLARTNPPVLVDVRANEVRFTPILLRGTELPEPGAPVSSPIIGPANRDLSVRVAIARMGDANQLHAVFSDLGIVQIHPLDGSAPWQFDAWGGRGDGAQHTLLWNMDGRTGAEIITYDPSEDSLYGAASSGLILDEWGPLMTERTANNLAVGLTTLGDSPDIDLDVVALAGKYLEVITLGANSAPSAGPAWPMPNHDPSNTGVWVEPGSTANDTR